MADAATISVLLTAKDEASAKLKQVGDRMSGLGSTFSRHGKQIGLGLMAAGAGIEVLAKKQQELTESSRKLAQQTGMTEGQVRKLAIELSNATFPLESAIDLMQLAAQRGLEGGEALKSFANFWDMVGDATGGSAEKMAEMSASLASVGIELGNETELLGAFGLMHQNTTTSVEDFIKSVSMLAPELNSVGVSVDDTAALFAALENEMGLVGRVAKAELKIALDKTEDGLAGVLAELGLTEAQMETYRGKVVESTDVMGELADIHMSTKTRMDKLKSSMEDLIFAHGGLIEKAATLAPLLLAVGPAVAGITFGMRALEPVIFRIRLAMIGLNMSLGVVTLVVLGISAAIVAGMLVWKNWDTVVEKTGVILKKVWDGIKKITEVTVNFMIGSLNKLTLMWRKAIATIADVVRKLLDMGSKLPFVGDKFSDAADAIGGFSDKLDEGIPMIDITGSKQEELQDIVNETAMTVRNASVDVADSNTAIADAAVDMSVAVDASNQTVTSSATRMADSTTSSLNRVSEAYEQQVKDRISSADLIKQIQVSTAKAEFEAEQTRLKQIKDDFAERVRISDQLEASRDAANASLISGLSEVNQKWKESGATVEEVMKLWSQSTDESFEEIGLKLDLFNTDLGDAESVIDAFAKGTGQSFFDMKDDIALALEEAKKTVEEKMADMGRVMSGTSFTDAAGKSLGLGQGGMANFQSMTADEQVKGIQSEAGKMLSGQNLVDLTRAGDPAVSGAAIDLIQGRWENDPGRLANEKILLEGGFGEVGESARTLARNSINAHLRLLAKNPRYSHLNQLTRDMGTFNYENSFGQANAIDIARQLAPQKYGKERDILSMYASGQITAFAGGGIVTKPTVGLVGEAGPEAIVPLGRGGGMGQTNNFHFHGSVYGVEDLKEAVVEAVRDHAVSGGFSGVFAEA